MSESFLVSFLLVGLAEIGDKTQIAVLALSAKHKERIQILLGVFCAFFLVDGLAVLFGEAIVKIVPIEYIKIISGAIFFLFGILFFFMREEGELREAKERAVAVMAFSVIFFSEFGDKTQVATVALAARFGEPWLVLLGVMSALMIVSLAAVLGGRELSRRIPTSKLHRIAGVLFIVMGIATWANCLL